jgi:hypothetical protein
VLLLTSDGNRVFVNGRERPVIMQNMRERIERGDLDAERKEAIQVCFSTLTCHLELDTDEF